jgi:Cysteine-rich secretory protein family
MKGSLLLAAALCALSAVASPIDKRVVVVTDVELTVVTVTVTESPSATSTPVPISTTSTTSTTSAPATSAAAAEAGFAQVNNDLRPVSSTRTSVYVLSSTSSSSTSTSTSISTKSVYTSVPEPTTTSSTSVSTSSTSSSATATGTSAYQAMIIESHNIHRANHSASDLVWNSTLAESALALANTCSYGHNTDLGPAANYGQNIAFGVASDKVDEVITDMMYNDEMMNYEDLYGEANPSMSDFDNWGHFSQIVWVDTTSVGCATVTCDPLANSGSTLSLPFTVCNYYPAGMSISPFL